MPGKAYVGGAWRTPLGLKVYLGGAWNTAKQVQVYLGGAWRVLYVAFGSLAVENTSFTQSTRGFPERIYEALLSWDNGGGEAVQVRRNGALIATTAAGATQYTDSPPAGGRYTYQVTATTSGTVSNSVTLDIS